VGAGWSEEHLRLVLEAPECLRVDDSIAIALECGPDLVLCLLPQAAARVRAPRGLRRKHDALPRFEFFPDGHDPFSTHAMIA
jgi:hypothetical protein